MIRRLIFRRSLGVVMAQDPWIHGVKPKHVCRMICKRCCIRLIGWRGVVCRVVHSWRIGYLSLHVENNEKHTPTPHTSVISSGRKIGWNQRCPQCHHSMIDFTCTSNLPGRNDLKTYWKPISSGISYRSSTWIFSPSRKINSLEVLNREKQLATWEFFYI